MGTDSILVPPPPDVPIVDAFVQVYPGCSGLSVPIPRQNLRDAESLRSWPSPDLASHLFRADKDKQERLDRSRNPKEVVADLDRWGIAHAVVPVPMEGADAILEVLPRSTAGSSPTCGSTRTRGWTTSEPSSG